MFDTIEEDSRRTSADSNASELSLGLPLGGDAQRLMQDRIAKEESQGEQEEEQEMVRAAEEEEGVSAVEDVERVISSRHGGAPSDMNADAALREGDSTEELVEEGMQTNAAEKRRLRKELLSERLREVFGLDEKEEVLEEMRCWLLRSVSKYKITELASQS